MAYYFAYGRNINKKQMKERFGKEPHSIGVGVLNDYKLCFNKSLDGKANIIKQDGEKVYGLIYKLSDKDLKELDKYEGVPNHYKREKICVKFKDKIYHCWVYIATKIDNSLKPPKDYIDEIINSMKENNFPLEYIERIKNVRDSSL